MTLGEWMMRAELDDTAVAVSLGVNRSTVNRVRRGVMPASGRFIAKCIAVSGGAIDANSFFADAAGDGKAAVG